MLHLSRSTLVAWLFGAATVLAGCAGIPSSGPSAAQIGGVAGSGNNPLGIQVVDLTDEVARRLHAERSSADFLTVFGNRTKFQQQLGIGDAIEVSIWEAPPATLFGAAQVDARSGPSNARVTVLPDQMIDSDGNIDVPFIGAIKAAGRTPVELQQQIAAKLRPIAHDPQVLVKLSKNVTSYVTVVGDVADSTRMQLTPRGERLLDALASAGGVRQPIDKITLQVTRGSTVASLPLDVVIRDPRQNVPLQAGDVVTALFQPFSFTALGATGKNQEVNFEAQGITLAQALARAGGLEDTRSDARGVFVFRLENADAMRWPISPVRMTADGRVPVIYRIDLKDPNAFFVAQSFMMDNKDVLYVSNAPVTEIQKVLNLVFSVAYPVVTGVQTFR
ncbi:polysaccharide export protein [Burkholderia multivorans]|uniref:polysaccharide biosynthesis/export family protein n=1 Tax=Burkholderia multivorans TaxID=87883 RepID=UPI000CFE95C9|nr:polysaccharide biosynthesis/export family protein [Burkholderia multivorans]MBU9401240.1 polysaccharide export protein [Burkholderia multivorans]MCO1371955.1 polysaccharide export protein [Burkholderia multivorans]MCO1456795.1 polysaccharide export protein [Burkholderia multivorans]MCO1465785.1 polysaccharide export protein [Burkholderia multivorans]MDN8051587.1 polysaccharide biosynthesis/export family protein [Burkholderia multivorans]